MSILKRAVASTVLVAAAGGAFAGVLIDDFSDKGTPAFGLAVGDGVTALPPIFGGGTLPTFDSIVQTGLTGVIGGVREASLKHQSGTGQSNSASATIAQDPLDASKNRLFFSQNSGSAGTFSIWWDGKDDGLFDSTLGGFGATGQDLTGGVLAFRVKAELEVSDTVPPVPYEIDIDVCDIGGACSALSFDATNTSGQFIDVFFPFAAFAGTADFSQIGGIQATLNSGANTGKFRLNVDVSLGRIDTPVPEPTALALVSVALLGVWATRRRKVTR
jgi:hypothetical protein